MIERVNQGPKLDEHELRLLEYIVDPRRSSPFHRLALFAYCLDLFAGILASTFGQVHLHAR